MLKRLSLEETVFFFFLRLGSNCFVCVCVCSFGPNYAPDGSGLQTGFGNLTSTILVIAVLSGLIVLVLLTFMILSGRTGGRPRASLSKCVFSFRFFFFFFFEKLCADFFFGRFSERAVGVVIGNVTGPIPDRYFTLLPSECAFVFDSFFSTFKYFLFNCVYFSNRNKQKEEKRTRFTQKIDSNLFWIFFLVFLFVFFFFVFFVFSFFFCRFFVFFCVGFFFLCFWFFFFGNFFLTLFCSPKSSSGWWRPFRIVRRLR